MRKHRVVKGTSENPLMSSNNGEYTYHGELLDRINKIMDHVDTRYYAKCFFMRLDFNFPVTVIHPDKILHPHDNTSIVMFLKSFNSRLKALDLAPIYLWVKEHGNNALSHHYHLALWLRGDKCQSIYGISREAEKYWARTVTKLLCDKDRPIEISEVNNGLVDHCSHTITNGVMLKKNHINYKNNRQQAMNACLYLAKTATKHVEIPGRNFGSSSVLPISSHWK